MVTTCLKAGFPVICEKSLVLNSEEARQRAAGKPWSFLHISKPEIDLAPDAMYAQVAGQRHEAQQADPQTSRC